MSNDTSISILSQNDSSRWVNLVSPRGKAMTCKLCNDTGEQRYWEARWRDEAAENDRLTRALVEIEHHSTDKNAAATARAVLALQQGQDMK